MELIDENEKHHSYLTDILSKKSFRHFRISPQK